MSKVEIRKAKLKDSLFLEVEYSEVVSDGTNNVKKDCTAPVHDDLKRAFRRLTPHLALLCGQVTESFKDDALTANFDNEERPNLMLCDPELLYRFYKDDWTIIDNMTCSGFTIGGSGDTEGVTLVGKRELSSSKVINLVSPFQKWDNDNFSYNNTHDLSEIIEACRGEVYLYLFEGKHAPDMQLSLFEEEQEPSSDLNAAVEILSVIAKEDEDTPDPVKKTRIRKAKEAAGEVF